jgi:DNA-directed RNA polymerase specialized sigma24 family protein
LHRDLREYNERLDFFEIRFNRALKTLRMDVEKQVRKENEKFESLGQDEESGDLSPDVERAAGSFDLFEAQKKCDPDYRLRLLQSIRSLPELQRTIIEMLLKDFPIDSQDPNVMTIARAVKKTEKTVRNQRDRAFATLKAALTKEASE